MNIILKNIPNVPFITQKISEKEVMLQFNCFYVILNNLLLNKFYVHI